MAVQEILWAQSMVKFFTICLLLCILIVIVVSPFRAVAGVDLSMRCGYDRRVLIMTYSITSLIISQ